MDHIWGAPSSVWKSLKTHILGAISCYFRLFNMEDPVCVTKCNNFVMLLVHQNKNTYIVYLIHSHQNYDACGVFFESK